MFAHIAGPDLDSRVVWAVDDLVDLLNRTQINLILRDFGKRTRQEDPVVHFYETFLAAYDSKMREARGVYYTPEPVVSYIVRSVDHILNTDFGLPDGLADASKVKLPKKKGSKQAPGDVHKVLILDPAAGTGTFLHGVIDEIHAHLVAKGQKGAWSKYVSEHLLPRLFGFELLMAPYAVAHMKLGLQLDDFGYKFEENERLRVYLTNTLEEAYEMSGLPLFAQWLSDEANAASVIKRDLPIMIVLGNPPYSGLSANMSAEISKIIDPYKVVDGKALGERKHWLHDDYVKFIRFGQHRIEETGYGVLAFITNHGYLDNPTFRGMRQSLAGTFDDIYILDLHGNAKKQEVAPDGSRDENVFDIQQGVAIGIFVKRSKSKQGASSVHHADLWGLREQYEAGKGRAVLNGGKYFWLGKHDLTTTDWTQVQPESPHYLFTVQAGKFRAEYEQNMKVTDIFPVNCTGIVTARDFFVTDFSRVSLLSRIEDLLEEGASDEDIRTKYFGQSSTGKYAAGDTRGWKLPVAREQVRRDREWRDRIKPYFYRPFDVREIYYTPWLVDWPRPDVMAHVLAGKNQGLVWTRPMSPKYEFSVTCTRLLTDQCAVGNKSAGAGISYLGPLYLYSNGAQENLLSSTSRRNPNLAETFTQELTDRLGFQFVLDGQGDLKATFGPEDVFNYVYAVLHSPSYRSRYAELLKIDFPRVPVTSNQEQFRVLCSLGGQLVSLHLLESPKLAQPIARFDVGGGCEVGKGFPKHLAPGSPEPGTGKPLSKGRVYINSSSAAKLDGQYFDNVPPEVWEFHIGGYQVCEKWLKDRRERTLTHDDIQHYQRVVTALAETIRLMQEIDAAIPKWPIE